MQRVSSSNPFDINSRALEASRHFLTKWMQKWNWDYVELREAIAESEIEKVGRNKFEAWNGRGKKIIFVYYKEFETIFVISGSEGQK